MCSSFFKNMAQSVHFLASVRNLFALGVILGKTSDAYAISDNAPLHRALRDPFGFIENVEDTLKELNYHQSGGGGNPAGFVLERAPSPTEAYELFYPTAPKKSAYNQRYYSALVSGPNYGLWKGIGKRDTSGLYGPNYGLWKGIGKREDSQLYGPNYGLWKGLGKRDDSGLYGPNYGLWKGIGKREDPQLYGPNYGLWKGIGKRDDTSQLYGPNYGLWKGLGKRDSSPVAGPNYSLWKGIGRKRDPPSDMVSGPNYSLWKGLGKRDADGDETITTQLPILGANYNIWKGLGKRRKRGDFPSDANWEDSQKKTETSTDNEDKEQVENHER